MTTSEINERLVYQLLTNGHYRKHMEKLRTRLQAAQQSTARNLEALGFELYTEPEGGMFLYAKLPDCKDSAEIAGLAAQREIMLAPGMLFRPHQEPSPWLRFNVASCDNPEIGEFLAAYANGSLGS